MNGQILRGLDDDQLADAVMARLTQEGLVGEAGAEWVRAFAVMSRKSLELLTDADKELLALVSYPLAETLETKAGKKVAEDDFASVVRAVLEAYESGELRASAESGALKKLFAAIGEAQGRSGKASRAGQEGCLRYGG